MAETELKIVIDRETARDLWKRAAALGLAAAQPRPKTLRSIYFDAPGLPLSKAGIALRLRRDGRRWIQTAKAKGALHSGLSRVEEDEAPAPGGRLDPARIADEGLRADIEAVTAVAPLAPVCETRIRRAAGLIEGPGGLRAELAVDDGEIVAGERAEPFREAEIELKAGPVAGLFDVALRLFPEGGLRFSRLSKAARGLLLAAEGRIEPAPGPRNAAAIALPREGTAEAAAQACLRECLGQIADNMAFAAEHDAKEGPHQLRVGLRRLRSALGLFAPAIGGAEADRLGEEARWLAGEAGALRDLDVLTEEIVAPAAKATPEEPGFAPLLAALERRRVETRAHLRAALRSGRAQAFLLHLARFVECRGWLDPSDLSQTERLAQPAPALADAALERAWRRAAKRAKGLAALDIEARHDLRKALKRLRYTIEFLASLYGEKRVAVFVKRLKALQDVFGALNDHATAEATLAGRNAPAEADAGAQRAAGRVLGAGAAKAEADWAKAAAHWRALAKERPFWG